MVNSGAVVAILTAKQPLMTSTAAQILIFSLLNIRKKTAAIIAGLAIGATCLWAISAWQNISREELIDILLASLLMLGGVMVIALVAVAGFKLVVRLINRVFLQTGPLLIGTESGQRQRTGKNQRILPPRVSRIII